MLCLMYRLSGTNIGELNSDFIIQMLAQLLHCSPALNIQKDQRHLTTGLSVHQRDCPFHINVFQEFCFSVTFENVQIMLRCFSYSCQLKWLEKSIFLPTGLMGYNVMFQA